MITNINRQNKEKNMGIFNNSEDATLQVFFSGISQDIAKANFREFKKGYKRALSLTPNSIFNKKFFKNEEDYLDKIHYDTKEILTTPEHFGYIIGACLLFLKDFQTYCTTDTEKYRFLIKGIVIFKSIPGFDMQLLRKRGKEIRTIEIAKDKAAQNKFSSVLDLLTR